MICIYRQATFSGILEYVNQEDVAASTDTQDLLEANNRIKLHWRVERNRRSVRDVKEKQGSICKACGFDYEATYGQLGEGYIEAHHNVPLADLPRDRAIPLDPERDFTVLCANCHRMVHQERPPVTLAALKALLESRTF